MALEDLTGTKYIDSLNSANPVVGDDFSDGVGHLQGIKNILKQTFANITGAVTATQADLNATSTLAADYAPYARARKNRIFNGNFMVCQRAKTQLSIVTQDFAADRWRVVYSHAAVFNTSLVAAADASLPFSHYMNMSPSTADASMAAADLGGYVYRIEGPDVDDFRLGTAGAETFTLSFWHAHTKTGTHSVSFRNSANDRSYVAEYTQSSADTWEHAEITVDGDTSGTWLIEEATIGLNIHFAHGIGSNYTKAAGSWGAGNYLGSTGQANNYDSTSNYFKLANVQLELGSAATDFERRSFAEELALCKRYYEKSYNYDVFSGTAASAYGMEAIYLSGIATAVHSAGANVNFAVQKMTTPSVYGYSTVSGTVGYSYDYAAAADVAVTMSTQGTHGFRWISTVGSSNTVNLGVQWVAGAEL